MSTDTSNEESGVSGEIPDRLKKRLEYLEDLFIDLQCQIDYLKDSVADLKDSVADLKETVKRLDGRTYAWGQVNQAVVDKFKQIDQCLVILNDRTKFQGFLNN